jgi:hypothetical protein
MSDQLALFPEELLPASCRQAVIDPFALDAELNTVDQAFIAGRRFKSISEYADLLKYIAHFETYSVFNGFLLFMQDPAATFIATLKTWARKYRRRPMKGARPLIILAPGAPILFVYDARCTEGDPLPAGPGPMPCTDRKTLRDMVERTIGTCAMEDIAVRETGLHSTPFDMALSMTPAVRDRYQHLELDSETRYLILLDEHSELEEKYATLVRQLGHIFCGHIGIDRDAWWKERKGLELAPTEIEAASVGYLVCRRKGLHSTADIFFGHLEKHRGALASISLHAVLKAANHIESMVRQEWKKLRKKGR